MTFSEKRFMDASIRKILTIIGVALVFGTIVYKQRKHIRKLFDRNLTKVGKDDVGFMREVGRHVSRKRKRSV